MPKRSRTHLSYAIRRLEAQADSTGSGTRDRVLRLKEEKIRKKIHAIRRDLRKDTKKARTFCIQRLIKRSKAEKSANTSSATVDGLDKQLAALKAVNIDQVADRAFANAVHARAELLDYPVMHSIIGDPATLTGSLKQRSKASLKEPDNAKATLDDASINAAEKTVTNAKSMQDAVKRAIDALLTTVQFLVGERDHPSRDEKRIEQAKAKAARLEIERQKQAANPIKPDVREKKKSAPLPGPTSDSVFMTSLGGHENSEDSGAESSEDEEEHIDWDSDISQPVYSDEEPEDSDVEDARSRETRERQALLDDISMSEDEEQPMSKKQRKMLEQQATKKKNRPGQHARRKMNEERFGKLAVHLQNAAPTETERGRERNNNKRSERQRDRKPHTASQREPSQQASKPSVEEAASSHPSWEARRRQREQEAALLRAKPSGTKIVFGDDDD